MMIADFFDTVGTVTAVGAEGGLLDEDRNLPKSQPVLLIDSLAAAAGGAGSVSSNTTYIESASGVADGARTGLASVATGVLFLDRDVLQPAGADRAVGGGGPGAGHRRRADDHARSGTWSGTTWSWSSRRS